MVTSVYEIQIVNKDNELVGSLGSMYKYTKVLAFMEEHPITNPEEHYRIVRTDMLEDEEIATDIVYEQETLDKENANE